MQVTPLTAIVHQIGANDLAVHLQQSCILLTGCVQHASERGRILTGWGICPANPSLSSIMVQGAWSAVRTKDTFLKSRYHRLAARRGKKLAIVAIAQLTHLIASATIGVWIEGDPNTISTPKGVTVAKLEAVEGIGEVYAGKLREMGISTTTALLKKGATPSGRRSIAQLSEISDKLILEWVNHVDLFRIKGIGEEYSDLLESAGVDTVPELAQRNPANLYQALAETNQANELVRRLPTQAQVSDWVAQAKQLPRVIQY